MGYWDNCSKITVNKDIYIALYCGRIGEAANGLIQLGRSMERMDDMPPLPATPVWTDSKLRRREALKKLAMGQKLSHDSHSQGQGMMGY